MAYKRGILDSAEALWLIGVTLASILAVLGIKSIYTNRNRLIRRLKSFADKMTRRWSSKKIFALLDKRPTDQLAKIAFSLLVWPKYGFPDRLLYMPRPPHYKSALKMDNVMAEDLRYPLSDPALEEMARKDLLTMVQTLAQRRSLVSLRWMQSFLEGRSADTEKNRNHATADSSDNAKARLKSRMSGSMAMADLQENVDSMLSSGLVDLCPTRKASGGARWGECAVGEDPTRAGVGIRRFKGLKTGTQILVGNEIIERATAKLRNDESMAGADLSALVEHLLWDYSGRPKDLLDE
jgi:hypothetical protein